MIVNIKNAKPKISFGLGVIEATINVGSSIVVWQNTIHNSELLLVLTHPIGITSTKINNQKFNVVAGSVGTYEIQALFVKSGTKLESNKIKLIVV